MKSLRKIYRAFGGKLHGSRKMKAYVCRTLSKFPDAVIDHITSDCWFLGSTPDAWAFTFSGDDLAGKHLIILSDDLLHQTEEQIEYSIAHEIGHVILGHRNAIMAPQTDGEVEKQEREADKFALQYIRKNL